MENGKLSLADLIFIGLLFEDNSYIKKYVNLIRHKKINYPSLIKTATEDNNKPYLEDKIFILIRTQSTDKNFYDVIKRLEENQNFYDKYQVYIDSVSHWVYIYNYPFKYYRDFGLIKEGLFSKISDYTKKKIIQYWNFGMTSIVHDALYNLDNIRNSKGKLLTRNELGEYFNYKDDPISLESFVKHELDY